MGKTIYAWFVFIVSELVCYLIFVNIVAFAHVKLEVKELQKPTWNNHALIMVMTMVSLNGNGMMIFRLFPNCETLTMKYVHAFIHTLVPAGATYSYVLIHKAQSNFNRPHFPFEHVHTFFTGITIIFYVSQYFSALYVYMCGTQQGRKRFATCHNFLGIICLQSAIVTACVQLQELNIGSSAGFLEQHAEHAMLLMVIYGVLVNSIVLNPYLEWPLVGPL